MSGNKTKTCPNCESQIKESIFGTENLLINEASVDFINYILKRSGTGYCTRCSQNLLKVATNEYRKIRNDLKEKKEKLSKRFSELIDKIPIVTLQYPQDWKYQSLEIVTAQSVIGTGVISEVTSTWTDFFGLESSRYSNKLKKGEETCKNILRLDALNMGGNAILGVDIDYSEAGGGKGMLMVCMAGTAVKIKNLDELEYDSEKIQEIEILFKSLKDIDMEIINLSRFNQYAPV